MEVSFSRLRCIKLETSITVFSETSVINLMVKIIAFISLPTPLPRGPLVSNTSSIARTR